MSLQNSDRTSHFSSADWLDSIRGLLEEQRARQLRMHVEQQCPECTSALALWSSVAHCLEHEPEYQPSPELLRAAQQEFTIEKPWKWLREVACWAKRFFDTAQQPRPAFVRAQTAGPDSVDRRFLHEAPPFIIDLTVKTAPGEKSITLIGQILDSQSPDQELQNVDLVLLSGEDLVAKTTANGCGEFTLECDVRPDLNLFISVRGEQAIGIPLNGAAFSESA